MAKAKTTAAGNVAAFMSGLSARTGGSSGVKSRNSATAKPPSKRAR